MAYNNINTLLDKISNLVEKMIFFEVERLVGKINNPETNVPKNELQVINESISNYYGYLASNN